MSIIGWQAAVAWSGLPRTTLRRLTSLGELKGTKRADGSWEFEETDLDRLREVREVREVRGTAPSTSSPDAISNTPTLAITSTRAIAPATASATLSPVESEQGVEDDHEGEVEAQPTFTPLGVGWNLPLRDVTPQPIGVDPETRLILYGVPQQPGLSRQPAMSAIPSTPMAMEPSDLETRRAEAWRVAWRAARIEMVANAIALEAALSGASSAAVRTAWAAASQAVFSLDDLQLGETVAYAIGRSAGMHASWSVSGMHEHVARQR